MAACRSTWGLPAVTGRTAAAHPARVNSAADLLSHLKMLRRDGRADGGDDAIGTDASVLQEAEGLIEDAGDDAAPAGVDGGDDGAVIGGEEDGDAIGGADGEEDTGEGGDEAVGGKLAGVAVADFGGEGFGVLGIGFGGDAFDAAAVDLRDPRPRQGGTIEGGEEAAEVFLDIFGGVFEAAFGGAGIAEVEGGAGAGGDAADARGEGVLDARGAQEGGSESHDAIGMRGALEHLILAVSINSDFSAPRP